MEQIVRVYRLCEDGQAEIIHVRESACSGDCHKCSGCGAAKETMIIRADNLIGAEVGDFVTLSSDSGEVLKAAVVVYLVPLVLFFLGYALGVWIGWSGGIMGGIGFALGVLGTIAMDRHIAKNRKTVYTITGYAPGQGAGRKGDNEFG